MGLVPTMYRALHPCNQRALCGVAYSGNDVGDGPCHQDAAIELVTITSTASGTIGVAFPLIATMRRGEMAFGSRAVTAFSIGGVAFWHETAPFLEDALPVIAAYLA